MRKNSVKNNRINGEVQRELSRIPYGVPSLAAAKSVNIDGDWTFGRDVMLFSDARLEDQGEPSYVPNGEYVGPQGVEPDDWV